MKIRLIIIFAALLLGLTPNTYGRDREGWSEYRSTHFIIYFKDAPPDFVKSVEDTAETYYYEITRNLGFSRDQSWTWDQRAKIYIYKDQDEYLQSAKTLGWSHGVADWLKKEIRTFPSDNGFFDSLLPHEMGHIILREFIGNNPFVPLWFDEGVAMYQEKAKRWGANREVKKAIEKNKFIPLRDLSAVKLYSNTDKDFVYLFYNEAASIVYYLVTELGEYRFIDLCKRLKDGGSFESALTTTYMRFKNLDELNKAWIEYLQK